MSHPSKQKGNRLEREAVKLAQLHGFTSKRAWGSNGQSIGMPEEVDMLIDELKVQCKSRKRLPKIFLIPECCDITILKENNMPMLVVVPLTDYLHLLSNNKQFLKDKENIK